MICKLGTFEEQYEIDLPPSAAHPILYVCPHCCEPWGMLSVPGNWCYFAKPIPCLQCGVRDYDLQVIPGSFIWSYPDGSGIDDSIFRFMSPALIQREFNLHLRELEKVDVSQYLAGPDTWFPNGDGTIRIAGS